MSKRGGVSRKVGVSVVSVQVELVENFVVPGDARNCV